MSLRSGLSTAKQTATKTPKPSTNTQKTESWSLDCVTQNASWLSFTLCMHKALCLLVEQFFFPCSVVFSSSVPVRQQLLESLRHSCFLQPRSKLFSGHRCCQNMCTDRQFIPSALSVWLSQARRFAVLVWWTQFFCPRLLRAIDAHAVLIDPIRVSCCQPASVRTCGRCFVEAMQKGTSNVKNNKVPPQAFSKAGIWRVEERSASDTNCPPARHSCQPETWHRVLIAGDVSCCLAWWRVQDILVWFLCFLGHPHWIVALGTHSALIFCEFRPTSCH